MCFNKNQKNPQEKPYDQCLSSNILALFVADLEQVESLRGPVARPHTALRRGRNGGASPPAEDYDIVIPLGIGVVISDKDYIIQIYLYTE